MTGDETCDEPEEKKAERLGPPLPVTGHFPLSPQFLRFPAVKAVTGVTAKFYQMRIDTAPGRPLSIASSTAPGMLSEWRVGAVLEAVAVRDAVSGQLFLNIGNTRYSARIASGDATGPRTGEQLKLRVLRTSPVLAVETIDAHSELSAAEDVTTSALRLFMPRQASPTLLLANLAWLATSEQDTASLPRAVNQAAQNLWNALPQAADLADPQGLEAAITQSGAFLENKLAATSGTTPPAVATDLKTLMLALNQALQGHGARASAANPVLREHSQMPSPRSPLTSLPTGPATLSVLDTPAQQLNELAQHTEGAVARLTTLQIAGTAQDNNGQAIVIELPIRQDDRASIARFRIERERRSDSHTATEESWTIEAALDLGAAGALHARVSLVDHRVSVQLRADSPAVVENLLAHSSQLSETLREVGLTVERVVCLHGMPVGDTGSRPSRLVDIRA